MLWLIRFISGYLRVRFYGEFKERIFNLAASNRISLWNSSLGKEGIEADISVKKFRLLPIVLRKSGIRVHILKKKGLPFILKKNGRRFGIALGLILSFAMLQYMSGFIWMIDVTGNQRVDSKEIISTCRSVGIKKGIQKDDINTKIARENLLLKIDSLAWASLNIEGCRLTVNVSEIDPKEDNECICNLKAKADAIIEKIDVTSGNTVVKIGDTVKKGEVLVSGVFEKLTGTEFVHSAGVITAFTQRSISVSGEYVIKELIETGEKRQKSVLEFFGLKIPLYLGKEIGNYNQRVETKALTLFGTELPIKIHKKEFRFTKSYEKKRTREELILILENEIKDIMKKEGVEQYEIANRTETETEKGIELSVIVNANENIAYRERILIDEEK